MTMMINLIPEFVVSSVSSPWEFAHVIFKELPLFGAFVFSVLLTLVAVHRYFVRPFREETKAFRKTIESAMDKLERIVDGLAASHRNQIVELIESHEKADKDRLEMFMRAVKLVKDT